MLICSVVGARPNFMKIAPVFLNLRRQRIPQLLVHTGQHYDANISQIFFEELGLPVPDIYLGVGSDTHACTNDCPTHLDELPAYQRTEISLFGKPDFLSLGILARSSLMAKYMEASLSREGKADIQRFVAGAYDWESIAEKTKAVYQTIVEQPVRH